VIFVSVGTHEDPFDRLLTAVAGLQVDEEIVVQCGPSALAPANASCVDYMSFDELVDHARRARVVVTHAGVGSIMVCLANGKRPVVLARRVRHGEHVDDHQVELATRMDEAGLVTALGDASMLALAVARHDHTAPAAAEGRPALAQEIGAYLASVVESRDAARGPRGRRARPAG
jgi:UDP-N-acetylglucosamine transferase subunit ALG13